MPVVFADAGIVVWMYSAGVLVSSCLADGAIRWVVEWDPPPGDSSSPYAPQGHPMIGLDDGSVVADMGFVARISDSGEVIATRYPEPTVYSPRSCVMPPFDGLVPTYVQTMNPGCGVLLHGARWGDPPCAADSAFYEWWSLDDLSTIATVPATAPVPDGYVATPTDPETQTTACQIVYRDWIEESGSGAGTGRLVSIGQTSGSTWTRELDSAVAGLYGGVVPTSDGGFLTLDSRGDAPFGAILTSYASDGTAEWSTRYSGDDVGAEVLREANVLMPDGTLWFATYNGLIDGDWLIVGVETGTGPGWVMNGRYGGGGNWARTNAPLAEAPTPDAGVPDSGATEPPDAGVASPDADVGP